jgi:hypothetical protein
VAGNRRNNAKRTVHMRRFTIGLCLGFTAHTAMVQAQEMDMEAMMKWASVDTVKYHIVGDYQNKTQIALGQVAYGDVTDRVVVDLKWRMSESKLVGKPTVVNTKTTVANLRDFEKACLPPVLKGDYEHYDLLNVKEGLGGMLEFQVKTVYPVVEVAQFCTASRKAMPAKVNDRPEQFFLPPATMMGYPPTKEMGFTADRKSFIVKKEGWVWIITPSL